MGKYELTNETKVINGVELHRVKALKDFGNVKKGDLGGWIEKEENLSKTGTAWVSDDARVSDDAWVSDDALVSGNAWVSGNALVSGDTNMYGEDEVVSDV